MLSLNGILHMPLVRRHLLQLLSELGLLHVGFGMVIPYPGDVLAKLALHLFKLLEHHIRQLADTFLDN